MNLSIKKLYSKYLGNWISISEDYSQVYEHSKDLDDLIGKLRKRKIKKGMIMKIPNQKYSAYVG